MCSNCDRTVISFLFFIFVVFVFENYVAREMVAAGSDGPMKVKPKDQQVLKVFHIMSNTELGHRQIKEFWYFLMLNLNFWSF